MSEQGYDPSYPYPSESPERMPTAIEELQMQLDHVEKITAELSSRLADVLRSPHPADTTSKEPTVSGAMSPLRALAERLSDHRAKLGYLIDRLDV
jgi:hypothetical protein